jgi:hypothetical protein
VDLRNPCDKDKEEPIARAEISYCVFDATYLETDLSSVIVDIHQKTLESRLLENKNPEELQTMTDPLDADLLLSGRDIITEKTRGWNLLLTKHSYYFRFLQVTSSFKMEVFTGRYLHYLSR